MIKRVIFIPQNKLSDRDYNRFGIEIIKSAGYNAEVWDFTPVLRPYYYTNSDVQTPKDFACIKVFFDKNTIQNDISELTSTDIIVCLIPCNNSTKFIFKIIDKSNIKYGFISLTSHPENYNRQLRYIHLLDEIKQNPLVLLKKIFSRLNNIIFPSEYYNASPSFILSDGEKGIKKYHNYINNKRLDIINVHNLDYDTYLNDLVSQEDPVVDKDSYAVYIDMYLPFSMDSSHGNKKNKPSATADTFYPIMRKYFDKFELKFNMSIVIAAHPRSNYADKEKSLYGDRLIIKNKTHNLIKYSNCVLTHHSTAAGIAVIYNKPMIFISPKVIQKRIKRRIKFMANIFRQKPINISFNHIPSLRMNSINKNAYKAYKNNYIKIEGTPEVPIWQIFCDYVNSTYAN